MTKEEAKEFIIHNPAQHLRPDRHKKGYICPLCNSGSGTKGTGMTSKDNIHFTCWACGGIRNNDIIDIIGLEYGLDDYNSKFNKACELYNIDYESLEYDPEYKGTSAGRSKPATASRKEAPAPAETKTKTEETAEAEPVPDFTAYLKECEARNKGDYLKSRGISLKIQKRFHVGYDPEWISPKVAPDQAHKIPKTARCIIPIGEYGQGYLARSVDNNGQYSKQKAGKTGFLNVEILKSPEVKSIFIVEGEIDALSIAEVGGEAISLGSTSGATPFIEYLKSNGPFLNKKFIIFTDADEAGQKAASILAAGFKDLGIQYKQAKFPKELTETSGIKDANELLLFQPGILEKLIFTLQASTLDGDGIYKASDVLGYFRTIETTKPSYEAKTGFSSLDEDDKNLYGGLHEGLYILGAISSLGKTTFCLQLADQIAAKGKDVIFFSMEQSKLELISKSISRCTYLLNDKSKTSSGHFKAKDTLQIMNSGKYKYYDQEEKDAINNGINLYSKFSDNIFIQEGRYNGARLDVKGITEIVENHIKHRNKLPVVFVDYLQIIAPADSKGTDKQNTDNAVFELKELSKHYHIPVVAISSFNRDNYSEPVSMASFKESGAIEYSSDVLLGLQYAGMSYIQEESKEARQKRIRELLNDNEARQQQREPVKIELKCLKNRNGARFTAGFSFVAAYNTYTESDWQTVTPAEDPFNGSQSGQLSFTVNNIV